CAVLSGGPKMVKWFSSPIYEITLFSPQTFHFDSNIELLITIKLLNHPILSFSFFLLNFK
ncbi:MAG: hypothetical protein ACKPKO_08490, partial [Candidatus Fonsibacter sp.]